MNRPQPDQVRTVAVIGTGVIGGGWAAHFLRYGLKVIAYDPAPKAQSQLRQMIDNLWPTLQKLGVATAADPDNLSFAANLSCALADADFVQESAPEQASLKIELLTAIDAATPPSIVIASSTSGFSMTELQQNCRYPQDIAICKDVI